MRAGKYLAVLAALLCSLAVQQRACAQYGYGDWHWQISLHPNGAAENYASTSVGGTQIYGWPSEFSGDRFTAPPGYGTAFYGRGDGLLQTGHSFQDGTVTVRAVWPPPYPGAPSQPPPDRLVLRLESRASWGSWRSGSIEVLEHVADNGLGDPEIGDTWLTSGVSVGKHVRVYDGRSGVVGFPITLQAHISAVGADSFGGSMLDTQAQFGAYEDPRGILLHREGARGETVDYNNVTHGDSIWSYIETSYYVPPGFNPPPPIYIEELKTIRHTFYPDFTNTSSWNWTWGANPDAGPDDFDWSWSPLHTESSFGVGLWVMPAGGGERWDKEDAQWKGLFRPAQKRTMVYTLHDRRDNTTWFGVYELTLHDPYEELTVWAHHVLENFRFDLDAGEMHNDSGIEQWKASTISEGNTWNLGVTVKPDQLLSLIELDWMGLSLSYTHVVTKSTATPAFDIPILPGYWTRLLLFDAYDVREGTGRAYDEAGLVAPGVPFFVKVGTGGGGMMAQPVPEGQILAPVPYKP